MIFFDLYRPRPHAAHAAHARPIRSRLEAHAHAGPHRDREFQSPRRRVVPRHAAHDVRGPAERYAQRQRGAVVPAPRARVGWAPHPRNAYAHVCMRARAHVSAGTSPIRHSGHAGRSPRNRPSPHTSPTCSQTPHTPRHVCNQVPPGRARAAAARATPTNTSEPMPRDTRSVTGGGGGGAGAAASSCARARARSGVRARHTAPEPRTAARLQPLEVRDAGGGPHARRRWRGRARQRRASERDGGARARAAAPVGNHWEAVHDHVAAAPAQLHLARRQRPRHDRSISGDARHID